MVWLVEGVRCDHFSHHFLQCYVISSMCFLLVYCIGIHDSWFKVSDTFSLVEHYMFIGITRDKYVDRCLALDLMNTTNYVDVWIFPFGVLSSVRKYAICVSIMGPLILVGTTPSCRGGILSVDLAVPIVALQSQVCV